jgi:quinol monooxygenase YgiN
VRPFSKALISLLTLPFINCAITMPFQEVTPPGTGRALVALTFAKTGDNGDANSVFRTNNRRIVGNMREHAGLIGYSVRIKPLAGEFWTMTVWEDEASLETFIMSRRHSRAMQEGSPALIDSRFARIWVSHADVPLAWDEALLVLEAQGRQGVH